MVDEDIRQYHAANLESRAIERARVAEHLHDLRAETADGAFLDRDEQLMFAREPKDELAIEWLGKACIGDCR